MTKNNKKIICDFCGARDCLITHCKIGSLFRRKKAKCEKLNQTLTEIKEIVTNFYETGFLRTDNDCVLINNNTCVETLDKILQKINEVENVEND